MSILPSGYPNIWVANLKRWVSEEYYLTNINPSHYEQMTYGAYDEEYGVSFITRKFAMGGLTYSVMLASVGMVGDDVHINSIERLFGSNEAPNFDTLNYSSERLAKHGDFNTFQNNERFYADTQEVISILKRDILLITDGKWYQNYYIKPI